MCSCHRFNCSKGFEGIRYSIVTVIGDVFVCNFGLYTNTQIHKYYFLCGLKDRILKHRQNRLSGGKSHDIKNLKCAFYFILFYPPPFGFAVLTTRETIFCNNVLDTCYEKEDK